MEEALRTIAADVSIVSDESGEVIKKFDGSSQRDLTEAGNNFVSLDRTASNLKMGQLSQLIKVNKDDVELSTRHEEFKCVSVVAAKRLDDAFMAENLVKELLD